jgi:hypothetical protein
MMSLATGSFATNVVASSVVMTFEKARMAK